MQSHNASSSNHHRGGRGGTATSSSHHNGSVTSLSLDVRRKRDSNIIVSVLFFVSCFLLAITCPFSLFFCVRVIAEYERAVIFRLGRITKDGAKGPGLFFIIPCMDSIRKVDLRTVTFDVPPQEVLTKDSVTVAVDAVVYYRIYEPVVSVTNVENADRSTRLLAATTLRNVLGTKNLAEILSERDSISNMMQSLLDEATQPWGVKVERVEVKDVRLPVQLQRAMAAEAEATRESRAKVIAAEGEQKSAKALKEAADVIHQSPFALQLRYLQTLNAISAEKNSTIIFPLPVDMLNHFVGGGGAAPPRTSGYAITTAGAAEGVGGGGNLHSQQQHQQQQQHDDVIETKILINNAQQSEEEAAATTTRGAERGGRGGEMCALRHAGGEGERGEGGGGEAAHL